MKTVYKISNIVAAGCLILLTLLLSSFAADYFWGDHIPFSGPVAYLSLYLLIIMVPVSLLLLISMMILYWLSSAREEFRPIFKRIVFMNIMVVVISILIGIGCFEPDIKTVEIPVSKTLSYSKRREVARDVVSDLYPTGMLYKKIKNQFPTIEGRRIDNLYVSFEPLTRAEGLPEDDVVVYVSMPEGKSPTTADILSFCKDEVEKVLTLKMQGQERTVVAPPNKALE